MIVIQAEIEKYFINKMFQVPAQALYFGVERETIQGIITEALARSEKYIALVTLQEPAPAQ